MVPPVFWKKSAVLPALPQRAAVFNLRVPPVLAGLRSVVLSSTVHVSGRWMGARGKEENPFTKGVPPAPGNVVGVSGMLA